MNRDIRNLLDDFIEEKHSLGYKYESEWYTLNNFITYCEKYNSGIIDDITINKWAIRKPNEKNRTYQHRLSDMNAFISYLNRNNFSLKLIKTSRIKKHDSFSPIILNTDEIKRLFDVLDHLPPSPGYRYHIDYPIMFRILYGCGLRISELINIKIKDFDIDNKLFIIRNTKNNQDKIVPMSESLFKIVITYYLKYNSNKSEESYFFRSRFNQKYARGTLTHNFLEYLKKASIAHDNDLGPRLHDLRHLFCCLSLHQMINKGKDPYVCLPILSTYVGHKSTKSTELYLHLAQRDYEDILSKVEDKYGRMVIKDE